MTKLCRGSTALPPRTAAHFYTVRVFDKGQGGGCGREPMIFSLPLLS